MLKTDEERTHQRQGKIARLPEGIREEVCQKILNGETGRRICEWLNGKPEVVAVLAADFGGEPVTDANLSRWRKGGYQDWLEERAGVARTRALAEYCRKLAEAGGDDLFGGMSAVLGGKIMDLVEKLDAEDAVGLAKAITALRQNELKAVGAKQAQVKLEQAERALQLAWERHKRETAEKFREWVKDERALRIIDGGADKESQLEALADLFWGAVPEGVGPGGKAEMLKAETLKAEGGA